MKKFSRSIVAALVVALCFTAFACGDKGGQNYDPETRPLVMSIQTPRRRVQSVLRHVRL